VLGTIGHSLADGVKHTQQSKQNSSPLQAIYDLQYQTQMKDPVFQRKEMKRKYQNKSYTLQPGDWGYKTQAMLDFVERYRSVSFSELKEYYDVILCGNPNMVDGGSFIHHLHSLVNWMNAKNRRCGRYLTKNTDGKYSIKNYK
jgi:hypothetical protein